MKLDALIAAVCAIFATVFSHENSVLINTLVACAAGTYASFNIADPIEDRRAMWKTGIACIIVGWAFTVVATALFHAFVPSVEITASFRCAVGAIVSCLTRFFMPWLAEQARTGAWVKYVPFLNRGN